jgi:hypothetical protein
VTGAARGRLDLARRRSAGELLRESLELIVRDLRAFAGIALAVVVPVELVFSGVGLGQLWGEYEREPEPAGGALRFAVAYLVSAPLLAAMTIHAVLEAAEGRPPSARRSIARGLDAFAPLFLAILLAAIGIAAGLMLLVAPGVFLAVRWYFVPQTATVELQRGADALRRSWQLVEGSWWRVFGIALLASVASGVPALLASAPLTRLAAETGDAAWQLAGTILAQTISGPFVAVASTLLYFDLLARRARGAPPPVVPPPPGGAQRP